MSESRSDKLDRIVEDAFAEAIARSIADAEEPQQLCNPLAVQYKFTLLTGENHSLLPSHDIYHVIVSKEKNQKFKWGVKFKQRRGTGPEFSALGDGEAKCVYIGGITEGMWAENVGLQINDIFVHWDDTIGPPSGRWLPMPSKGLIDLIKDSFPKDRFEFYVARATGRSVTQPSTTVAGVDDNRGPDVAARQAEMNRTIPPTRVPFPAVATTSKAWKSMVTTSKKTVAAIIGPPGTKAMSSASGIASNHVRSRSSSSTKRGHKYKDDDKSAKRPAVSVSPTDKLSSAVSSGGGGGATAAAVRDTAMRDKQITSTTAIGDSKKKAAVDAKESFLRQRKTNQLLLLECQQLAKKMDENQCAAKNWEPFNGVQNPTSDLVDVLLEVVVPPISSEDGGFQMQLKMMEKQKTALDIVHNELRSGYSYQKTKFSEISADYDQRMNAVKNCLEQWQHEYDSDNDNDDAKQNE